MSLAPVALHRFYYLDNFHLMLATLERRDGDLLDAAEVQFIREFHALRRPTQALLVRLVMRKGTLFRGSRLRYDEIRNITEAARGLVELEWLDDAPCLTLDELFGLFTKADLACLVPGKPPYVTQPKAALRESLAHLDEFRQPMRSWWDTDEVVYRMLIGDTCARLRLMFFGNFRQALSEFVLADLGVFKYETYDATPASRPFKTRRQVDDFHRLHLCREMLHAGAGPAEVAACLPERIEECEWLEERRQKLRFQIGRSFESAGELAQAAALYEACTHPEAAVRAQRLARRAAGERARWRRAVPPVPTFDLSVEPTPEATVETLVARRLQSSHAASCVHYVENTLMNSLFGLLCWPAVFAPIQGAFFHPFHYGPADMGTAGFVQRRREAFDEVLGELATDAYRATIRERFREKYGVLSPFVVWAALDESLLSLALDCIPASHLLASFQWMLRDLRRHRSGFPDLMQFWPHSKRYQMIEVKAPGDRLQDTQCRYLAFALASGLPVSVCRVSWVVD